LGQILSNIATASYSGKDVYYLEDDDVLDGLVILMMLEGDKND
jgi:hypothetical protein